jgi:hypothetical protein
MIATAFDEENDVSDGPPGTTSEQVMSLSVWRGPNEDGIQVVISCWKPTKEELDEIVRTGRVWIVVWGRTMPPICPVGTNPFEPLG